MRIDKVRDKLTTLNLDAILFTNLINIRYLCGYSGSNGLLFISKNASLFFTDFRYKTQAPLEVVGAEVLVPENYQMIESLALHDAMKPVARFGFEKSIAWSVLDNYKTKLPGNIEWVPIDDFVNDLRAAKTLDEIKKIKKAINVAESAMLKTLPLMKPGTVEIEFAAELEYNMRKLGAEKNSFDTIVVSGPRSALVHGVAADRKFEKGDFVTVDWGAYVNGYASDITRTYILGEPSNKQREIYELVYRAQASAINAARPGISGGDLDKVARDIIAEAGYGEFFGHGLGHGIGLLVHDPPRAGKLVETLLPENSVLTIEPGVYLPDFGGVRIEDDVLLLNGGCEVLTSLPKKIEDMIIE